MRKYEIIHYKIKFKGVKNEKNIIKYSSSTSYDWL